MKSLALWIALMTSCACGLAEESLVKMSKEYILGILNGTSNKSREFRDFSGKTFDLYGFTIKQLNESLFFFQEGKSFEQCMNEAIAFEIKKSRFFRAVMLVAFAGDLGFTPKIEGDLLRDYLEARYCYACGSWWAAPYAYTCCRCKAKVHPRCTLKDGHPGEHVYDPDLGPMPGIGSMSLRPYGP